MLENANATLTKGATVLSFLTNSTGQISTQTLTYGYYDQAHGDTIQDAGQWNLTVTYPGLETYSSAFWPLAKMDWAIALGEGIDVEAINEEHLGLGMVALIVACAVAVATAVMMVKRR